MLLCTVIVPLVYFTRSHCLLLPLQRITSSFLAICQLSATDLFQHNFTYFLLEYLGFGSIFVLFYKQITFFCLDMCQSIHLQEKDLLVTTSRDTKIVIFSVACTVLVRFTCFSHHSAETEFHRPEIFPYFTDRTIKRHMRPSQYSSAPYKHMH